MNKQLAKKLSVICAAGVLCVGPVVTVRADESPAAGWLQQDEGTSLFQLNDMIHSSEGIMNYLSGLYPEEANKELALLRILKENEISNLFSLKVLEHYTNIGIAQTDKYIYLREKPDDNSGIVGKLFDGNACDIVGEEDGWYKVNSGTLTDVYVKAENVISGQEAMILALKEAEKYAIPRNELCQVRNEASEASEVVKELSTEDELPAAEAADGWVSLKLSDDEYGYVRESEVSYDYLLKEAICSDGSEDIPVRTKLVNFALQFVGNPYVWGGESLTRGADCSGFTMKIYEYFGISLPHSASAQSNYGRRVSASEMKPGDLVFYSTYQAGISHVAIYIGNGKVVHAASSKTGIRTSVWNFTTPLKIVSLLDD